LVVVPRLLLTLNQDWRGTTLPIPPGRWKNELTGSYFSEGPIEMHDLLAAFPVALLIKE
jgi:(1->4)-alpha-D-glucan 1-alpha-D-glucosylmutase